MPSLQGTKSGGWRARKRLPQDVKAEYRRLHGKAHEEKLTLPAGTSESDAKKRYIEWLGVVEGNIAAIRAARDGTGISLTPREAAALSGQWYSWFTSRADNGEGHDWERWRAAVQDGIRGAVSRREAEAADSLDELWDNHRDVREAVRPILADIGHTAQFLATQTPLNNIARDMFLDCLYADLAAAIRLFERRADQDYGPDTYPDRFPTPTGPEGGMTILQLFEHWVAAREPARGTIENWRYFFRDLDSHLEGKAAASLSPRDAKTWLDGRANAKRSKKTVANTTLRACHTVFGWAAGERILPANPFAGLKMTVPKGTTLRKRAFTTEEARVILGASSAITDTCKDREAARRWVPWLCAYTGARPGEITQLRKQDVVKVDGIDALVLTPDAGTIKTREARTVPLHEHLLAQGFLEFVSTKSEGPLFYSPSKKAVAEDKSHRKPMASQIRQRLANWIRSLGVDDKNISPLHAWRHTFKQIGGEVEIPDKVLDAICGHAPATEGAAYGRPTLKTMANALEKFPPYQLKEGATP